MNDNFPVAQQENVLAILAHSDRYGKLIANLVDPQLFEGDYRIIAEKCIAYWKDNHCAPKLHAHDLFDDSSATFDAILNDMVRLSQDINGEYVVREISKFTRLQKLKEAITSAAEVLSRPTPTTISETEALLSNILRARDYHLDAGMTLRDSGRLFDYLDTQYEEFTTGRPQFDKAHIVPARGTVDLFLAGKGWGKSWWLVNLGKRAVQMRKKVLHISLENSEEETTQRYMQAFFAMPKHMRNIRSTVLDITEGKREGFYKLHGFDTEKVPIDLAFDSSEVRMELGVRLDMLGDRADCLVIKRFPTRRLSPEGLLAFLDGLEMTNGFVPDLVLLDYIGLTQTPSAVKDYHNALARNIEEFRAICIERNHAFCTAHQLTREGFKHKTARSTDVAEAWGLIHTADVTVTMSGTHAERRHGLARLVVDHARQAKDKFGVLITQNYEIGQFVLQSIPLPPDYFDRADKLKDVGYDEDEGGDDE